MTGCLARACWLLVSTLLLAAPVFSAVLAPLEPRVLAPGERLQVALRLTETSGVRVSITLGDAPADALLTVNDAGQLLIDWQPGPELADETLIELIVTDIDTGQRLQSRQLLVRRAGEANASLADDDALNAPTARDSVENDEIPDPDLPSLTPLANQVISAGRVVSMRVAGSIADGTVPVLQVDRLPRNASFDANEDGSRVFYWQTGDKDQGEHLFRFTAINPDDTRLQAWSEVLIVVGDPSRNKTIPSTPAPNSNE